MEMTQSTRNPVQRPNLKDTLPMELATYALKLKHQPLKTFQNAEDKPIFLIPRPIPGQTGNIINLSWPKQWLAPVNLNPGIVCYANPITKEQEYLTTTQFWMEGRQTMRIDDDLNKYRYTAYIPLTHLTTKVDGPNSHGYFIIANDQENNIHEGSKYKILIGKITDQHHRNYVNAMHRARIIYDALRTHQPATETLQDINQFLDNPPKEKPFEFDLYGRLKAIAFNHDTNRFVVIDNKKFYIFQINSSQQNDKIYFRPQLIHKIKLPEEIEFKRVCFLSEATLLGLATNGRLYSFYLDNNKNIIYNRKIVFKDSVKIEEVLFKDFAVDPLSPCQIILQNQDDIIFLWNLKKSHFKEHMNLMKLFHCEGNTALWFHNSNLSLLFPGRRIETYTVKSIDDKDYELYTPAELS